MNTRHSQALCDVHDMSQVHTTEVLAASGNDASAHNATEQSSSAVNGVHGVHGSGNSMQVPLVHTHSLTIPKPAVSSSLLGCRSFYVADRKFYAADIASRLYQPSAYYIANAAAAWPFIVLNTAVGAYTAYGLAGLRYQVCSSVTLRC